MPTWMMLTFPDDQMEELPPCEPEYELVNRELEDPEVDDPWPYDELKTMPGLRMPRAEECFSSEFQSVLSDEELLELGLSDMMEEDGGGESLVLMGGGEPDCLIFGEW